MGRRSKHIIENDQINKHPFPQFPPSFRRIVDRHSSSVCTRHSISLTKAIARVKIKQQSWKRAFEVDASEIAACLRLEACYPDA
jgi:hypothetical protein